MATRKWKVFPVGRLKIYKRVFSRSLNDNRRMVMSRAIFYKIFQSECLF